MPKTNRNWISVALLGVAMTIGGVLLKLVKGTPRRSSQEKDPVNHDVMAEARDVDASVIGWVAIGIVASAVVIHLLVGVAYAYFSRTEFRGSQPVTLVKENPRQATTVPALQVKPKLDLERLRESEQQTLNSYGWVDQQKGVVRIPIDEAMKRVLANGLPPAEKAAPSPSPAPANAAPAK